jgi:F0F1-type ATP synthase assembly protein I
MERSPVSKGSPDRMGSPRRGEDPAARAALGFYVTQGFAFAAVLLAFTGLGYWLDTKAGTLPLLTLVGAALGGVGGFVNLYRSLTAPRPPGPREP